MKRKLVDVFLATNTNIWMNIQMDFWYSNPNTFHVSPSLSALRWPCNNVKY